ncbi:G2/mitotic-specific cyclin-B [Aethina tumida]|uniref:G2/mitotic-specific cyclin-B n=1 Tax=Aethina tumida TaxID=116153 RepID=UPI00096B423D|nr:G2/mitotic-specific cyclin-B [Aethina tumida]
MISRKIKNDVDSLPDRENLVAKSTKATLLQHVPRPALGELGNRMHITAKGAGDVKKGLVGKETKKVFPKQNSTAYLKCLDKVTTGKVADKPTANIQAKNVTSKPMIFTDTTEAYTIKQLSIMDPDEDSKNDPQMVAEYLGDIFNYLRELEDKYAVEKDFLYNHKSTPKMRAILINWLVEVHQNFKLCLETLHLCVSLVDRYLQVNKTVGRELLQLVGTSALLIASKYEEVYIPDIEDFTYICDNTFSRKQVLTMEASILKTLDFNLGKPASIHFLRRYSKIAQAKSEHHNLGKYILELALLDYNFAHVKPSLLAAAACCLSIAVIDDIKNVKSVWTILLRKFSTYSYDDIRGIMCELAVLIDKSPSMKYQAVRLKYASSKFLKISLNPNLSGTIIKRLIMHVPKPE